MGVLKYTDDQRNAVCRLYNEGESIGSAARIVGMNPTVAGDVLKKAGIPTRTIEERQRVGGKYHCNHDFFADVRTSERAAYWMGFIAADGCIKMEGNSGSIGINLAGTDADHLRLFAEHIQTNAPIRAYKNSGYKCGTNAFITIRSCKMVEDLAPYGIVPRKTTSLLWPNLPDEMLRHYLRGLFDGDGCWSILKPRPSGRDKTDNPMFRLCGTLESMQGAQDYLMSECGIGRTKIGGNNRSENFATLSYGGLRQVTTIARLMYDDSTVYLRRKFERIAPFLGRQISLKQGRKRLDINWHDVKQEYEGGLTTMLDLGEKYCIGGSTVYRNLKRIGADIPTMGTFKRAR